MTKLIAFRHTFMQALLSPKIGGLKKTTSRGQKLHTPQKLKILLQKSHHKRMRKKFNNNKSKYTAIKFNERSFMDGTKNRFPNLALTVRILIVRIKYKAEKNLPTALILFLIFQTLKMKNSSGWTRTNNLPVNSRFAPPLSY